MMAFWELEQHPSGTVALIDEAGRFQTYAALRSAADDAAEHLPGKVHDLGFILFENLFAAVAVYLGALRSHRAVPLLVHTNVNAKLLGTLIATYTPAWVAGRAGLTLPEAYAPHYDFGGYMLYSRRSEPDGPLPHPDCAVLLSTSGSTGSPKLVRLSYSGLAHNAASIAQYLKLLTDDRAVTTLPLAYSFGMSILNSHLAAGGSLTLTDHGVLMPNFWHIAAGVGITSLSGVPSTFEMLRRIGVEKRGLTRLRTLCQAGGHLPDALTCYFATLARENCWSFFVMYGQTEASPRISYVPPERLPEKVGSIGIPIPGGTLEIDNATGELIYRGPNVMMGYAVSRQDLAKSDECAGELRTGDLARKDDAGFFYLTGRLKRFVKLSGNRVNLDEVEIELAKALGVPIACAGEDERLVVALPVEGVPEDSEVLRFIRDLFNIFGGVTQIRRVTALPRLANGKVDYACLNAMS